jgi:hypothetical protein
VCGNLNGGRPAEPTPPARAMDMVATRRSSGAAPPTLSAAQLHHRPATANVIDLRQAPQAQSAQAQSTPSNEAHERHVAQFGDRFERARQFSRSAQISRFGGNRVQVAHSVAPAVPSQPAPATTPTAIPNHVITQHQAMTQLPHLPAVPTPAHTTRAAPKASWRPHLSLSPNANRFATTAAAIVILGGYVWLQNYPKLAVQNAGSQAGLTAALPSYLPSSYSLAGTTTGPGLLTLKFHSPSADKPLTIAQRRTSWDPSSLLDNFVAKNADDYAAVEGQGLTIYLYGNNSATWVNHGIWYTLAGTDHLSRDQVLKIAYSL